MEIRKFTSKRGIETFDPIIDRCQALKSVKFYTGHSEEGQQEGQEQPTISATTTIDMLRIISRPSTKKLEGTIILCSDYSLVYMMEKYPQLEVINVQIYKDAEETTLNFSAEVMARFLSYKQVSKILLARQLYYPNTNCS